MNGLFWLKSVGPTAAFLSVAVGNVLLAKRFKNERGEKEERGITTAYLPTFFWSCFLVFAAISLAVFTYFLLRSEPVKLWAKVLLGIISLFFCCCALSVTVWKIEFCEGAPSFVYRTVFGRTYTFSFGECESFRVTQNAIYVKTTDRSLVIDIFAENETAFVRQMKAAHVPQKKVPVKQKVAYKTFEKILITVSSVFISVMIVFALVFSEESKDVGIWVMSLALIVLPAVGSLHYLSFEIEMRSDSFEFRNLLWQKKELRYADCVLLIKLNRVLILKAGGNLLLLSLRLENANRFVTQLKKNGVIKK